MEDNNSPKLVFEPEQEDEKDYTMVTAYLNEEFASIKAEEEGNEKAEQKEKTTQKTTQKTTTKTTIKKRALATHAKCKDFR